MGEQRQIEELLTIADVARILVCSEANVYAIIDAGELPYIPIGKAKGYRIDPADLASFLEERKIQKEGVKHKTPRPRLKHIKI